MFPCLILKKDRECQVVSNHHTRILIVSDGKISKNGDLSKNNKADCLISYFKYDIHDFFNDIRGNTREAQFHLAGIFLSINDNMKISSIEMTPLEYAMHILKSCYTNRPFNN